MQIAIILNRNHYFSKHLQSTHHVPGPILGLEGAALINRQKCLLHLANAVRMWKRALPPERVDCAVSAVAPGEQ